MSEPDERPIPLKHRLFAGPAGVPVVILHGMLGSSRNWQTLARDLAQDRQVYALDLRNHGLSPHAPQMGYEAMARDVAAWMDATGLARCALVGHSMGGKTAMLLSCRQPARVERLVVVDIAPKDYYWPAHRQEFAAMAELDLSSLKSRAEAEMRMEGRVPSWAMRKFLATNLEQCPDGNWRWIVNLPVMTQALGQLEANPLTDTDSYRGPSLFLTGAKSSYVMDSDHDAILRHFPAARIESITASGHNPHVEARGPFLALLSGFLAGA